MRSLIPARQARTEILVDNSCFVATLAPVFSVEEARAFIARIRSEFSDASYNVPAFIVGRGASVITHAVTTANLLALPDGLRWRSWPAAGWVMPPLSFPATLGVPNWAKAGWKTFRTSKMRW